MHLIRLIQLLDGPYLEAPPAKKAPWPPNICDYNTQIRVPHRVSPHFAAVEFNFENPRLAPQHIQIYIFQVSNIKTQKYIFL